jgi:hypothetical protein
MRSISFRDGNSGEQIGINNGSINTHVYLHPGKLTRLKADMTDSSIILIQNIHKAQLPRLYPPFRFPETHILFIAEHFLIKWIKTPLKRTQAAGRDSHLLDLGESGELS